MNYSIDSSWPPKEGNTLLKYEDAFYSIRLNPFFSHYKYRQFLQQY
ncbi:hypothetical protein DesyoDRAFT_2907 [Desulfosporosinus youngiae DSM 17734]|uniref:Uncharacterized protein n=1 Tax=Desulfosporosinus youngiae DSM 17734 TaxID=768710 RepID=H5Y4C7_9FIRM|nr:hypothetical protein DesyoDRAFT_2907 [Desulfosporosinus youngiae DSM 17734]